MVTEDRVILALDDLSKKEALSLVKLIGEKVYAIKIHDLFDEDSKAIVHELYAAGAVRVWVDVKLHDIPNIVKLRKNAINKNGACIITVHTTGGMEMMRAAAALQPSVKIYGVTVLTSLDDDWIQFVYRRSAAEAVLDFALAAKKAGIMGVVCSPKEIGTLASCPGLQGVEFIVPGSRSIGVNSDDQKRIDIPANTMRAGATRLVIGRQITKAENPIEALNRLEQEIAEVSNIDARLT